ncbi:type IV toxin-antitoxin system AbiEi family antitoxin domain-containing protein [Nocardioides alkalitolerans]|uniref:type IV toxin-antitoxin system AbiEi family antitoxin domain-containing protein n=1 Tax=Nocardioides alkalitolerans TaxID=281714 RepID=UPI0004120B61|nr:type IV toxin-antitoxin system AbiEi family antitoxin domain-containing protein [Nocardioides alkalitolerans]
MALHALQSAPLLDDSFPMPVTSPFTPQAARREGIPRSWLTQLVRSGHLRRVVKGVYVAAQVPDSTHLRVQSLALVVPPDAIVCDRHAAWLHGAPMVLAPNEHLELQPIRMFRPAGHERLRSTLADSGQRAFSAGDVVDVEGLRVTSALRTAWDLGRVRQREHALSGLDAMLRLGVFPRDELLDGVERFRGERWITHLRELAPLADGRSESPGESVCRLRWIDMGLEPPDLQIEIREVGVVVVRLDLGRKAVRFAVEYDGEEWHSSAEQVEHDRVRRTWMAEHHGYLVAPVRAKNVYGPERDIERIIDDGLVAARARSGRRAA